VRREPSTVSRLYEILQNSVHYFPFSVVSEHDFVCRIYSIGIDDWASGLGLVSIEI
jgi:hypothetical protein